MTEFHVAGSMQGWRQYVFFEGVGGAETLCGGAGCLPYVRVKIISPSRRNKKTNPVDNLGGDSRPLGAATGSMNHYPTKFAR